MAKSSLIYLEVPAHPENYTKGRLKPIRCITVHHMAGVLSAKSCGGVFARAGRKGSAHYGIGNDGEIANYVDENDTAWTNSNWDSNCESVTIEVSNSKMNGNWPVSDKAFDSLVRLVADIAKRNSLGKLVKGENLTWHRMFTTTSCPGEYLLGKMDEIAEKANAVNGFAKPAEAPQVPETPKKTNEEVAEEVMAGKWGNDPERAEKLRAAGYDRDAVQAIVNREWPKRTSAPASAPASGIKAGDKVSPIKYVDEKGVKLAKTRDFYFVHKDYKEGNKRVVLCGDSADGEIYAALKLENVKKA